MNIEVVDAKFGITLVGGSNNEITESNCSIYLEKSFNNSVFGNERIRLLFSDSSKNIVRGNNITDTALYGFKLQNSSNENSIFGNNITNSISGIEFHGDSCNNEVYGNNIVYNHDGIVIVQSTNNSIYDNIIAFNSHVGICFQWCVGNKFYRNYIENNHQTGAWLAWDNIWDNGSVGNYWSDYKGTDNDGDGIGNEPYYIPNFNIETGEGYDVDNYPLMEPVVIPYVLDVTSPTILIKSPENKTYTVNDVALTFTVNESNSWISYSLDGKDNVSIIGNITLSGLSNGLHNLTVYATDTAGNTGASETIYFTIVNETEPEPSEPFPTILVLGAIMIIAVATASVIVYLIRKRKK